MSDFVKQNEKILRSLNINIVSLSDSSIEYFKKIFPENKILWEQDLRSPSLPDQFGRGCTLNVIKIEEGQIVGTVHISGAEVRYDIPYDQMYPSEKLFVATVLIRKYLS